MSNKTTVNYDEIKSIVNDPNVLIVDVRNPEELKAGKIGNCINIPLADVAEVLRESNESFQEKYGRTIPQHEDNIILYCQRGARALKAWETAVSLGFKNAKYYPGSYAEWSSKN